jgi:hypothetical protein
LHELVVGRPGISSRVFADGSRLFEQLSLELRVEIFREPNDFFCKLFDEQVSFKTNSSGIATALTYTQQKRRVAQRLE